MRDPGDASDALTRFYRVESPKPKSGGVTAFIKSVVWVIVILALLIGSFHIYRNRKIQQVYVKAKTAQETANYGAAIALWHEYLKLDDSNPSAIWTHIADAHRAEHRYKEASEAYRKAITYNAKNVPAYEHLCECLRLLNDNRGAYDAIVKAAEIEPENQRIAAMVKVMETRLASSP